MREDWNGRMRRAAERIAMKVLYGVGMPRNKESAISHMETITQSLRLCSTELEQARVKRLHPDAPIFR